MAVEYNKETEMNLTEDVNGIYIRADSWEEEQVFKLMVKALWLKENGFAVYFNTYEGDPAYKLDRDGMYYVGAGSVEKVEESLDDVYKGERR